MLSDGTDEQMREQAESIVIETEKEGRADMKARRAARPAAGTGNGPFAEAPFKVPGKESHTQTGTRGQPETGDTRNGQPSCLGGSAPGSAT